MDNLINETNSRLQDIMDNLTTIKSEYESKLKSNNKEIDKELSKVKKYKEDFFAAKQKVEKMNDDITGFEEDYKNLVDRFKDDELANILVAANKEISAKIDERKRKIAKDKIAMNELVEKAENSKNKLVKLTAEKKALELCLSKILDAHEFYTKSLQQIINYSEDNRGNLSACFYEQDDNFIATSTKEESLDDEIVSNDDIQLDIDEEIREDVEIEEEIDVDEEITEESSNENQTNEDELNEDDVVEVESVNIDEIEINENDDDIEDDENPEDVEEIKVNEIDDYENEDIIEGDEHKIIVDEDSNSSYDYNENLDLENIIDFDDSLEDDASLYEEKENED